MRAIPGWVTWLCRQCQAEGDAHNEQDAATAYQLHHNLRHVQPGSPDFRSATAIRPTLGSAR